VRDCCEQGKGAFGSFPCRAFRGGLRCALWRSAGRSGAEIKCDVRRGIAPGGDDCDSGFGGRGGPSPMTQGRFIGCERPSVSEVYDPQGCFG
jgi:hypothetical protein